MDEILNHAITVQDYLEWYGIWLVLRVVYLIGKDS